MAESQVEKDGLQREDVLVDLTVEELIHALSLLSPLPPIY